MPSAVGVARVVRVRLRVGAVVEDVAAVDSVVVVAMQDHSALMVGLHS